MYFLLILFYSFEVKTNYVMGEMISYVQKAIEFDTKDSESAEECVFMTKYICDEVVKLKDRHLLKKTMQILLQLNVTTLSVNYFLTFI